MTRARGYVPLDRLTVTDVVARYGTAPRTTAQPVLWRDANEQAWLEARTRTPEGFRIGASEMAAVLCASPYASPYSLWWSKQPGWEKSPQTRSQRWGHRVEQVIGAVFEEDHPEVVVARSEAMIYRHPTLEWLVCTPDFLSVWPEYPDEKPTPTRIEPIEAKSDRGGKGWGKPGTDRVPFHHYVQAVTQAMIFGSERAWIVRNDAAYPIPITDARRLEFAEWAAIGSAFVASLETGTVPDLDGDQITLDTVTRLHSVVEEGVERELDLVLLNRYTTILAQRATLDEEYRLCQARIREAMRDAEFAVDSTGRRYVQRRHYKRDEYTVKATVVDGLWPVAVREEA